MSKPEYIVPLLDELKQLYLSIEDYTPYLYQKGEDQYLVQYLGHDPQNLRSCYWKIIARNIKPNRPFFENEIRLNLKKHRANLTKVNPEDIPLYHDWVIVEKQIFSEYHSPRPFPPASNGPLSPCIKQSKEALPLPEDPIRL